ncbi:MAG: hypothetical protein U0326_42575 [Polyangiales bacterium]
MSAVVILGVSPVCDEALVVIDAARGCTQAPRTLSGSIGRDGIIARDAPLDGGDTSTY